MFTTKLSSVARTNFSIGLLIFKIIKIIKNYNFFVAKSQPFFFKTALFRLKLFYQKICTCNWNYTYIL